MSSTTRTDSAWFSTKGQVVIPAWLRKQFHIEDGTRVVVQATADGILLKPVTAPLIQRGRGIIPRKKGSRPLTEEWAEHKKQERELEERHARQVDEVGGAHQMTPAAAESGASVPHGTQYGVDPGPISAKVRRMGTLHSLAHFSMLPGLLGLLAHLPLQAAVQVQVERVASNEATAGFRFPTVPPPSRRDAASSATFRVAAGVPDPNGGAPSVLHDGRLPTSEDQPARNFFFAPRTLEGRIVADLGRTTEIRAIHTYSWHAGQRAPQVYRVYGHGGSDAAFDPLAASDPTNPAWKLIARVDTRSAQGEPGSQHGVRISDLDASLGSFRHLLFVCQRTTQDDPFDQTFFSEIDVLDATAPTVAEVEEIETPKPIRHSFEAADGKYRFTIDSTLAPDLTEWAQTNLVPVVREWYPRIVELLPSEGFAAPERVLIEFKDDMGGVPASAGGGRIHCNIEWFRRNLRGEAVGSVVHEMVHVVQQYGRPLRGVSGRSRPPGWLVEGIPDYLRWFLYEPATRGAEITARNFERARFDGNYRISANFLNWVVEKHGREVVVKLNAAAREGRYREELWRELTGKSVQELGDAWREANRVRLGL